MIKYSEIENVSNSKFLYNIKLLGYEGEWIVTEKIHGSNFSFSIDTKNLSIEYFSRNQKLTDNDSFYNYKKVIEAMNINYNSIIDSLKNNKIDCNKVIIFGEIFGGYYPGIEKDNTSKLVQKGIYYSPNNRFLAFDVIFYIDDDNYRYANYDEFLKVLEGSNIQTAPLLKRCSSLSEALLYPNDGTSMVHKLYNLPELENNIMEGVVIKPFDYIKLNNDKRVILKHKNSKFSEVNGGTRVKQLSTSVRLEETENYIKELIEYIPDYINENRLNAVISKMVFPETIELHKKIGMIIGEMSKDVYKDISKDHEELVNKLDTKEKVKVITKRISMLVGEFVSKILL